MAQEFVRFQVLLKPKLCEELREAAMQNGMNASSYIRNLLINSLASKKDANETKDFGSDISSLTRIVNRLGKKFSKKSSKAQPLER